MHDALGDALVIEMENLLAKMLIFHLRRATGAGFQRILVVGDRCTLLRRQDVGAAPGDLVRLAARAARNLFVNQFHFFNGSDRPEFIRHSR